MRTAMWGSFLLLIATSASSAEFQWGQMRDARFVDAQRPIHENRTTPKGRADAPIDEQWYPCFHGLWTANERGELGTDCGMRIVPENPAAK